MDHVPFVACINLLEREDRYVMISEEFRRIGIADRLYWHRPKRHPQSGRVGCFESHLAVFRAALERGVPFAMVCEDDVRFSTHWREAVKQLTALAGSGVAWNHASLQNSGGEVSLERPGDAAALPAGVRRGAFYFTRCYAITREAMERAVKTGVTRAHIDVGLAVANWGKGFIIRPAAVSDVPSRSDNDWAEGGWGPWMAGQMQGVTHLPCVIADRWKLDVIPHVQSRAKMETVAWKKFMSEPGAQEHLQEGASEQSPGCHRAPPEKGHCWSCFGGR